MKQRNVPWIGAFMECFFTTLPVFSIFSTIAILIVLYANIQPYLLSYVPWITLWSFLLILIGIGLIGMLLMYKFVVLSIWRFRSGQQRTSVESRNMSKDIVTVVVSGGFDPLNGRGHITHIQEAKKLGDKLVVILSRDDQLKAKGNKPGRSGTFYPDIDERIAIMKELRSIDQVVINIDEDGTCAETLRMIRPQILAKGGDRTPLTMPQNEIDVCREIGCRIVYNVGSPKTTSSSALVRRSVDAR